MHDCVSKSDLGAPKIAIAQPLPFDADRRPNTQQQASLLLSTGLQAEHTKKRTTTKS